MSGLPTVKKNQRERRMCYQETHILLEVPSIDYSLSLGNFRGIFSHTCVPFTRKKVEFA